MYQTGAAFGFTPDQTGAMTLWEFAHVVEGCNRFHGGDQASSDLSDAEFNELAAWLEEPAPWETV